tara:strand:+ start:26439 stop:27449 length:1011 start_codon:yes stop_codon:yes gene_type:complete
MTTETTIETYERIVARLSRSHRLPDNKPGSYASAISSGDLSPASQKMYASAVRHHFRADPDALDDFEEAWSSLRPASSRRKRKRSVPPSVITALHRAARQRKSRSRFAEHAATLAEATALIGLRPCEWADAAWEDEERTILVVRNAKRAEQMMDRGPFAGRIWKRGNGDHRALELSDDPEIRTHIQSLADDMLAFEVQSPWSRHRVPIWAEFKALLDLCFQCDWLDRKYADLTLYSFRHQFSAEAKALFDQVEVAAMMGHISSRTAGQSYAHRRRARAGILGVKPTPSALAAVEHVAARQRPLPGLDLLNDEVVETPPSRKKHTPERAHPIQKPGL